MESRWSDGQQRQLAVGREPDPHGPNHRDVIQLLDPVPPGQSFQLNTTFTSTARIEDGVWVFTRDQKLGHHQDFYRDTVVLPPGAELISAAPSPVSQEQRDGTTILRFEGERSRGSKWVFSVKYRSLTN